MKHLVKNIAVAGFSILFILLSIKSSYAAEEYTLKNIEATSTKTIELELDKNMNKIFTQSDLEVYKTIINKATKVESEKNKILLTLDSQIEKNTNYSLVSISAIEGDIIFKTGEDILLKEIQNTALEANKEGIKSILIKDSKNIVLTFTNDINSSEFDFQLLKTIKVEKVLSISGTSKVKVLLKGEMLNKEKYLGTLTFLQTSSLEKIEINKGINYFTTGELVKYEGDVDLDKEIKTNRDKSLEDSLMEALNNSQELNGTNVEELKKELNSAAEDPVNKEKSQLEKLALSQKETPDTGAETWVILLATFIINTFYYISRRKKVSIA